MKHQLCLIIFIAAGFQHFRGRRECGFWACCFRVVPQLFSLKNDGAENVG